MNFAINQTFLSSAFAVSVALHGVALAVLTHTVFTNQNHFLQIVRPESPIVKTIEVSLKSISPTAHENDQIDAAIHKKLAVPPQSIPRKPIPTKAATTEQAQKPARTMTLAKQPYENKKTKATKQPKINNPKLPTIEKPDILLSKAINRNFKTHRNVTVSDQPKPILTKATTPIEQRPLNNAKTGYDGNNPAINKPSAPAGSLMAANLTYHASGISSTLPPLLKSRQPDYPEEARWEERTGKAILKFKISGQGSVLEPQITKSSGHRDLDMAAIRAIQFWRFKAKEMQAATQWYQYSFRFELN
jgi:periplasmic protein TonB